MKKIFALLAICLITASCGKKGSPNPVDGDSLSALKSLFQLPIPTGVYTISNAQSLTATASGGSNVRDFIAIVNQVALPLREADVRLNEVTSNGERKDGGLEINYTPLTASLKGTRRDSDGMVDWAYTLNGLKYFEGSVAKLGSNGTIRITAPNNKNLTVNFSFAANTSGQLGKTVGIQETSGTGKLQINIDYSKSASNPTVEIVDAFIAGQPLKAKWGPNGGNYQHGFNNPKPICWDANLNNYSGISTAFCPNQ